MELSGPFEIGDTTERIVSDVLAAIPEPVAPEDTDVFVRPRDFARPSSMYPMVSIEDADDKDRGSRPSDS
jgi:hypothetical protein